uniref:Uncharacterized protein n=1 Tax=Inoviridae sp. ctFNB4 TaxID=2823614 RepID=A0A8S5LBH3_9VIRU|nr:MAG TPA: hypothetical protein [Inoviridae sp. ctFNB4]
MIHTLTRPTAPRPSSWDSGRAGIVGASVFNQLIALVKAQ